jgi:hypothetical protein
MTFLSRTIGTIAVREAFRASGIRENVLQDGRRARFHPLEPTLSTSILVALTEVYFGIGSTRRFFAVIRRLAAAGPRLEFLVIVLQHTP